MPSTVAQATRRPTHARRQSLRPQWNALRRELTLAGKLIKRFRQRPGIQEHILQTFEEEGWPDAIDDPLPGRAGKDAHERLHNAVQRLNRCQKEAFVRFERDGTGSRILWKLL